MASRRFVVSLAAVAAVGLAAVGFAGTSARASSTGTYTVTCQRGLSAAVVGAPNTPPVVDSFADTENQRSLPCSGSVSQSASSASADASATSTAAIGDLTAAVAAHGQPSAFFNGVGVASVGVGWSDLVTVTGSAPSGTPVTLRLTLTLDDTPSASGMGPCLGTSGPPFASAQATFSGLAISDSLCNPTSTKTVSRDLVTSVGSTVSVQGGLTTGAEALTQPGGVAAAAAVDPAHAVAHIDVLTAGAGYTTASGVDFRSPSAPAITSGALPDGDVGQDYGFTVTATGVPAPSFSATGLPDGVSIDPTSGTVFGTPNTAGKYSVTVTASNGVHPDATATYEVTIGGAPAITSGSLPDGLVGHDYSFTVTASGVPAPTLSADGLPDGLTIDPVSGVISGQPTTGGEFTVTITASNGVGDDATATYALTVDAPPVITSDPLPDGIVGHEYDVTVTATGEPAPTFAATGLPSGMDIDPHTGEISGSLLEAGVFHVHVTASNGIGDDATADYEVTISSAPAITSGALPDGAVGEKYGFTVTADGLPAPTFGATGLPDGLTIDAQTGEISGTPATAGPAQVTVTAGNGIDPDATATYDMTIGAPVAITSGALPDGVVGEDYSFTVTASGSPAPTFSALGLPDGLVIDPATGAISGKPTSGGSSHVVVTASNGVADDAIADYDVTIDAAPAITSGSLPDGVVGQGYSFTVTATGVPAPTFSATGLPDGLSIDATTGAVTGTPTTAGPAHVTVTASNGIGPDATVSYDLSVAPPALPAVTFAPSPLDFGTVAVGSTGTQMLTVTDTGNTVVPVNPRAAGPFSVETTPGDCGPTLSPGGSCTLHVQFRASRPGAQTGTLTMTTLGTTWRDTLTGTTPSPIGFSPSPLNFGQAPVHALTVKALTLANLSGRALPIGGIDITAGRFRLQPAKGDCAGSIPAGGSCTLHIAFGPNTAGPATATLSVQAAGGTWTEPLTGVGGGPVFSPSPLDFGQAPVHALTVKALTLGNPSTRPLPIDSTTITPGRFRLQPGKGDCVSSIPAGGSCTLHIAFGPGAAGPATATLSVQAAGGTWTEPLTGIGGGPVFTPSPLDFGTAPLQAMTIKAITLGNPSTGPLRLDGMRIAAGRFQIQPAKGDCASSIPAGGSCTLHIAFRPDAAGPATGTLSVTALGATWTEPLTGIGGGPVFTPSPLDFGQAPIGAFTVKVLTLGNPSTRPLPIDGMKITAGRFQIQPAKGDCVGSIPAGGGCTVHIGFEPNVAGPATGTLSVTALQATWTQTLTGTGGGPVLAPSPLDFGQAPVDATTVEILTLGNPSNRPIPIDGIAITPGRFRIQQPVTGDCKASIPAQGSCTVHVGFSPTATGPATATLSVRALGATWTEPLTGTATPPAPIVTVSPSALDFGGVEFGSTSSPLQVTVTNSGSADLRITGLAATGEFAVSRQPKDCVALGRLTPGGHCTVAVVFGPTSFGPKSGTLTLTGSGGSLPFAGWTVSLTGRGTRPRPGA